MRKALLTVSLAALLWASPVGAKTPSYVQSHWNCQVQCQDLPGVARQLEELVQKHGGRVQNLNSDVRSGSGNLNARIPEENLLAFSAAVSNLGTVMQQSRSLSDNTSSYAESKRQLELAEKMANAHIAPPTGVSQVERALFEAEFKAYLRDRINSQRNSLAQYERNQGWAEVSVSLQSQGRPQRVVESGPVRVEELRPSPAPVDPSSSAPSPSQAAHPDRLPLAGAFLLIGGGVVYLLRRVYTKPGAP